nr:hypothetical protein [Tanacetum cinerariifolium]
MAFKNFMYAETNDDLYFLPNEPSPDFGTGSSPASINTEPPIGDAEPVDRKCKTRGGLSRPSVKHKLAQGSSSSRATRAKTTSLKDASPLLIISDDDEGLLDILELQNINACHLKVFAITPLAVVENVVNRRSRELLKVIEQIRGECDVMKERES